uniref:AAA_12 domain-containing protein n=1 Tax=Caenorhabditis japonica TaxID=281687 RepID=A0A8R1DNH7_CAEJA
MATRNKRAFTVDEQTNFVSSNQLASQLLAVEEAVLETTAAWFANNFMSWCSSFNAIAAATHAATASNPTLAARQLLKKENIFARYIGSDVLSFQVCSPVPQDSFEFVPFTKTCYSKPALRVRLPTNTSIVTFIDLTTRYVSNKTLHSLDPFSLQLKSNSDFQLSDIPSSTALGAVPQEHLIFHNLVLGSLSENIQDTHYNEIWKALQGSPAAITRIISTHGDPNSGPLSVDDIQKAVSYWENAKWLWELVFYAWTLVTNLLVTILVGATIVMILATNILASYLPFKRTDFSPEQPQTPEVRLSDYTNLADRLRSPRINALSHSPEYFSAVIPLKANEINCWALIDTGASFTVAGQNIRHLLGIPKLQEPSSQTALGLGGNEVHMAGSAVVKFQIGNYTLFQTTHFTVGQCTPGGPRDYDFIMGNNALARLPRFVLDYANGVFEVGNDKVPLGKPAAQSIFSARIAVHVLKDTIIPPFSESFVDFLLPVHNAPQNLVLISQSNTLTEQEHIITPAVFKNAKILVTNPTNEAKILYANTTAASAAPMKRETIKTIQADEASQLSLYAFTALALTFGRARIALVGDIRQLPPFEDPDLPRDLAAFAISRILASATRTKAFPVIDLIVGRRCPPPITKIYLNALSVRIFNTIRQRTGTTNIGVLCFYKEHAGLVSTLLGDSPFYIGTIDGSQRHEFKVVVVLTTRTSPFRNCPFLEDNNRINVAISRTKRICCVVLHTAHASPRGAWSDIIHRDPTPARTSCATTAGSWIN